jgi:hypothetical protein
MNARNKMLRSLMLAGLVAGVLFASGAARAATNPASCVNDIDCVATPECGGDVCTYTGANPMTCVAAGGSPKGSDGWCDSTHGDNDCKCKALGAKCTGIYCSFTKPSQAPATGAAGSGGGAGATGAAGSATGAAGSTTGAAGSTTGAAGATGAAGTGTSGGGSSGGCAVAASSGGFAAVGLLGLALVVARRRRR